jgi:hypothetical protein
VQSFFVLNYFYFVYIKNMKVQIIKPDSKNQESENRPSVFLAGSIEMGVAEDWQAQTEKMLGDLNITIFNPRRDDWDNSWTQEQKNLQFNYQVNWEMNKLEEADIVLIHFLPGTKSPISLLELGLHADNSNVIVCCPEGFWRKGNVEIVCTRYNIPFYENFENAIGAVRTKIQQAR